MDTETELDGLLADDPEPARPAAGRGSRHRRSDATHRRGAGGRRSADRRAADGRAADRRTADRGRIASLLMPVHLAQIVTWEIALVAAVLGWGAALPTRVVTLVVAAALVAITSLRVHGLCGYQWAVVALRYRIRRRTSGGADAVAAALPELLLQAHFDRAGNHVGLAALPQARWSERFAAGDGDDWTGVVRVAPAPGQAAADLVGALSRAAARADIALSASQLVAWTVPAPADGPPVTAFWLAVHYRRAADPVAAQARGGGATGATRSAAVAALGLARDLAETGYAATVLDEQELRRELLVALGADVFGRDAVDVFGRDAEVAADDAEHEVVATETWRDWSVGRMRQTSYRPRRAGAAVSRFGDLLPGSAFTCWSITLRRDRRHAIRREVTVRAGAVDDAEVDTSTYGLVRLYGRQAAFVRASVPLAAD